MRPTTQGKRTLLTGCGRGRRAPLELCKLLPECGVRGRELVGLDLCTRAHGCGRAKRRRAFYPFRPDRPSRRVSRRGRSPTARLHTYSSARGRRVDAAMPSPSVRRGSRRRAAPSTRRSARAVPPPPPPPPPARRAIISAWQPGRKPRSALSPPSGAALHCGSRAPRIRPCCVPQIITSCGLPRRALGLPWISRLRP
jgi:hypothetical protein